MIRPLIDTPIGTDLVPAEGLARLVATELGVGPISLVRSSMNAIYAAGEVIIRVGRTTVDPIVSIGAAQRLSAIGVEAPRPWCERSWSSADLGATAWHRIDIDTTCEPDWHEVGRQIRVLHSVDVASFGGGHPLPNASTFSWWDIPKVISEHRTMNQADRNTILSAWERLGWVRDRSTDAVICHGDLHPGNVVVDRTSGRTVILDWDLLCMSDPLWDHAPMMRWAERWGGRTGDYERFAAGYGRSFRHDENAESTAELRLLVATVMRVLAAEVDPRAEVEAQRRLGYWTGTNQETWNAV